MEELLIVIIQFLIEFVINALSFWPFDWPSKDRATPEPESISGVCFLWFCGGCLLAGVSLFVFKNTFIYQPVLRLVNLVLAPIASAFISQTIARYRAKKNVFIIPRNHFWQAFWFTVGLVIIRFTYATRA